MEYLGCCGDFRYLNFGCQVGLFFLARVNTVYLFWFFLLSASLEHSKTGVLLFSRSRGRK